MLPPHLARSTEMVVSLLKPRTRQAAAYMDEAGIKRWRLWCYMLVKDVPEAERRALALKEMGITPFAQPYRDYDGGEPTEEQKHFAIWVNKKSVFKTVKWSDFDYKKSCKGGGIQHD